MAATLARVLTTTFARRTVLAALGALALAGCAPSDSATTASSSAPGATASSGATTSAAPSSAAPGALPAECAVDKLALKMPGMLMIGTDNPAYSPWFLDNDPKNGKGFESAVAYAVAAKLGFAKDKVSWTTVSFNAATAPGPKTFDIDINQVSITDERKIALDFSSGYYDVTQALVTVKGSKIAAAKSIADLAGAKLGAQVGTTSYSTITDVIKPTAKPAVFNSNDDAKLALGNGQIDGLVVDLPTALYIAAADLKNGVVVGQFENTVGTPEQFGLVLDKGSKLTPCVSAAVDALRADGTLKTLESQWLTQAAGAPVLK